MKKISFLFVFTLFILNNVSAMEKTEHKNNSSADVQHKVEELIGATKTKGRSHKINKIRHESMGVLSNLHKAVKHPKDEINSPETEVLLHSFIKNHHLTRDTQKKLQAPECQELMGQVTAIVASSQIPVK